MKGELAAGVAVALIAGVAVSTQGAVLDYAGRSVGAVRSGLLAYFAGGTIAGLALLALRFTRGGEGWVLSHQVVVASFAAGTLGITILASIAFLVGRISVTAGFATILCCQMLTAAVIDTLGLGAGPPLPLDQRRVLGLVAMGVAVFLFSRR